MGAIGVVFSVLAAVTGLATMACFVLVVVEMFKRQKTGIAIACIVLFFLTLLLGPLVAFGYGWSKSKEWKLQRILLAYAASLVLFLVSGPIAITSVVTTQAARREQKQQQTEREMEKELKEVQVEELKIETH